LAESSAGAPALVVEVKASRMTSTAERQLEEYLRAMGTARFGMLVDTDQIRVYESDGHSLHLVSTLNTSAVLSAYEPGFAGMRILGAYLETLVGSWLRDLMDHWKHEKVPGEDELRRVGLLSLLEGGRTRSEVQISGNHLS
jgi:hypothetical protein